MNDDERRTRLRDATLVNLTENRRRGVSTWEGRAYDYTCQTVTSRLAEPMRADCADLTEVVVASGHWMAQEKPEAVNASLAAGWQPSFRTSGPQRLCDHEARDRPNCGTVREDGFQRGLPQPQVLRQQALRDRA